MKPSRQLLAMQQELVVTRAGTLTACKVLLMLHVPPTFCCLAIGFLSYFNYTFNCHSFHGEPSRVWLLKVGPEHEITRRYCTATWPAKLMLMPYQLMQRTLVSLCPGQLKNCIWDGRALSSADPEVLGWILQRWKTGIRAAGQGEALEQLLDIRVTACLTIFIRKSLCASRRTLRRYGFSSPKPRANRGGQFVLRAAVSEDSQPCGAARLPGCAACCWARCRETSLPQLRTLASCTEKVWKAVLPALLAEAAADA
eukprot:s7989_g2.t1